jgi:drug/metabolite transporter (DMT)-like permease
LTYAVIFALYFPDSLDTIHTNIVKDRTKGILYASATALLWGFLAIVLKASLADIDPVTITWFRFAIAFVLLAVFMSVSKPSYFKIVRRPPWLLIFAALALGLNYLGFITGIHYTTPSNAQVFIQTGPILLALSGIFIYKEKLKPMQLAGLLFAVAGLITFYSEQLKIISFEDVLYNKGVLWVLFGAVSWATYANLQKNLVKSYPTNQLNLVIYGLPALLYTPFIDLEPVQSISLAYWLAIIFLGVNTLVAYTCMSQALKYVEANIVSVIITVNPIITFVVMGILTGMEVTWMVPEHFTMTSIFGALMVLSGAGMTIFFSRNRHRKWSGQNRS